MGTAFTQAVGNSFKFKFMFAVVLGQTTLSLILASPAAQHKDEYRAARAVLFPTVLSSVSVAFS